MVELIGKYLLVILISMFKFMIGPLTGFSLDISMFSSMVCTVVGMMTTVIILSYTGTSVRSWWIRKNPFHKKKKKLFTKKNRRIVWVWQKYGMNGVAFLTPILLMPTVGTILAVSFGEKKRNIIYKMFLSAVWWSVIVHSVVYFGGDDAINYINKGVNMFDFW